MMVTAMSVLTNARVTLQRQLMPLPTLLAPVIAVPVLPAGSQTSDVDDDAFNAMLIAQAQAAPANDYCGQYAQFEGKKVHIGTTPKFWQRAKLLANDAVIVGIMMADQLQSVFNVGDSVPFDTWANSAQSLANAMKANPACFEEHAKSGAKIFVIVNGKIESVATITTLQHVRATFGIISMCSSTIV
jgi:hypothetical protein